jgi:hypothetical protein
MPTLRPEYVTPQLYGNLISCEVLPIPDGGVEQVQKVFERLGNAMPQPGNGIAPRQRTSTNDQIIAYLSTTPGEMKTPTAILKALGPSLPKTTTVDTLATRLKNGAGKSGMWIVEKGKYGMPVMASDASPPEQKVAPATKEKAAKGPSLQNALLAFIQANPKCTKEEVNAHFVGYAGKKIKVNHIGVAISRLITAKKISGGQDGPYTAIEVATA